MNPSEKCAWRQERDECGRMEHLVTIIEKKKKPQKLYKRKKNKKKKKHKKLTAHGSRAPKANPSRGAHPASSVTSSHERPSSADFHTSLKSTLSAAMRVLPPRPPNKKMCEFLTTVPCEPRPAHGAFCVMSSHSSPKQGRSPWHLKRSAQPWGSLFRCSSVQFFFERHTSFIKTRWPSPQPCVPHLCT